MLLLCPNHGEREASRPPARVRFKTVMALGAALAIGAGAWSLSVTDAGAAEPGKAPKKASESADAPAQVAQAAPQPVQLTQEDLKKLVDTVNSQNKKLDAQNKRIKELERIVKSKNDQAGSYNYGAYGNWAQSRQRAERRPDSSYQRAQNQPVGQPDSKPKPREVEAISDFTGVLAQPGQVIFTPSLEYAQSNLNRFAFSGIEVVDTVLIGAIEATDSDRDTIVARAGLRFGITNRIEGEVKVPFVHRSDRVTNLVVSTDTSTTTEADGTGLGDIEASVRYQFNEGKLGWPIFIGGLRVKSDTGEGPFDVKRDTAGIETELPTGSGFWSVEPGITMLFGSDPAVFFANLKYNYHMKRSINKTVGGSFIGEVDPGDAIGMAFGIGIGLNELTSVSFAYEHNFIDGTRSEIDGTDTQSANLDVGSLAIGVSYSVSSSVSLAFSLQAGLTEDAPDVVMTVRVPITF